MIGNSVPIQNTSKDPVINELLDIKVPQSQKSLMNSLIASNENPNQLSMFSQNNFSAHFDLNNPLGFSQTYQSQQLSNTAQITSTDENKMNFIKQQMQAINKTPEKNEVLINQTKTFPNKQNNNNYPFKYNYPINNAGNEKKILLSPNLGNNQNIQRFNTVQPQFYENYNPSAYNVQKFTLSDNQLLNMNQTNFRPNNHQQHLSSKNIDPRTLNIMNTHI